jgi:LysR family transcriptional regulator, low CO2-responsive transcriptional regulator
MAIVFSHLRSFHAVAQHRGFTAAATALHISQPTVTTQVKELEDRYGVELLVRRGRRVEMTDTGAALYEISRRIMSLHDEAEELMQSSGKLTTGQLRLAAVGPFHATEMVAHFLKHYPAIKVKMSLGNSDQTLQRILALEADVAILAHNVSDPRVSAIPFSSHEVVAFVNVDHPWSQRDAVTIAEFAGQPLIWREKGSTTRRAFEAAADEAKVALHPLLEIGSREGVWKAVEQGLGVGIVADFEFVAHPRLRTVRIADAEIRTEYHIACLSERLKSPKIAAFLETVMPKSQDRGAPRPASRRAHKS